MRCVDHGTHILVRTGSFLRNASRGSTTHHDAAGGKLIDNLPTAPSPGGLVPAHGPSGSMTRGTETALLALGRARQHVRSGAHRAPDEHRLSDGAKLGRQVGMCWTKRARRPLAVHIEGLDLPVDDVLLDLARVV